MPYGGAQCVNLATQRGFDRLSGRRIVCHDVLYRVEQRHHGRRLVVHELQPGLSRQQFGAAQRIRRQQSEPSFDLPPVLAIKCRVHTLFDQHCCAMAIACLHGMDDRFVQQAVSYEPGAGAGVHFLDFRI